MHCLRYLLGFFFLMGVAQPVWGLEYAEARHLLSRTGFGSPSHEEILPYLPLSREQAVVRLLTATSEYHLTVPPKWVLKKTAVHQKKLNIEQRKKRRQHMRKQNLGLQEWWFRQMLRTHSPLNEKMALFWHNHFVSSVRKVKYPMLMYRQQMTFRRFGMDRFDLLLEQMLKDPALLLYLDAQSNRLNQPNENFARELYELFTLGEGHYSESDIKETARALTGIRVRRKTGRYRFVKRQHDTGNKTIFGQTGHWGPQDLSRLILSHPEQASFITHKLYLDFVSVPPSPETHQKLIAVFQRRFEIQPLLKSILLSPQFWAPEERGQMIKSPLDLLLGSLRLLGATPKKTKSLVRLSRRLGQDIFAPPNVKGWSGGTEWVGSQSLLLRQNILARFLRSRQSSKGGMQMNWQRSALSELSFEQLKTLILPIASPLSSRTDFHQNLSQLLMDPRYQLK